MRRYYKDYLFQKHILVSERGAAAAAAARVEKTAGTDAGTAVQAAADASDEAFAVLFALASLFGIRVTAGAELAEPLMIRIAAAQLGEKVPEPFYRGFPESVRGLTKEQKYFDQLLHYARTYGMGDFSEAGHSVFEQVFERTAFKEKVEIKEFVILPEAEAVERVAQAVEDLLAGTRPLSEQQYSIVKHYLEEYCGVGAAQPSPGTGDSAAPTAQPCAQPSSEAGNTAAQQAAAPGSEPGDVATQPAAQPLPPIVSKNTAVRLLLDLRDLRLAETLMLSDVIKLVGEMQYRDYGSEDLRKLNLKNRDRKFLTGVIDGLIEAGRCDAETCCEKKEIWNGLLHHLHYKGRSEEAREFVGLIRGRENRSVYAAFEKRMAQREVREALQCLRDGKGSGAVLRSLDYLVSRCESEEEVRYILDSLKTRNVILLLQLLMRYGGYRKETEARTFRFVRFNRLRVHGETEQETAHRRSAIGRERETQLAGVLREQLQQVLKGRLGKVWIDPDMRRYAVPLQMSTSQGGYGVLPTGSRLPVGEGRILRAFTYWERVDDIDLSVIGITEDGRQIEFSWRTMALNPVGPITYSGDQTSGYNGGSEFFDIDLEKFRKKFPPVRYLVLCDNVYSDKKFSSCFCKAGYMLRERKGSGQVFEPKTVRSSFLIDCDGRFAYLFGIDLETREFVWLNIARSGDVAVAGTTPFGFLTQYFHMTEVCSQYDLFGMMASEIAAAPEEAEVIVTDKEGPHPEGADVIREYDFERVISLMNTDGPKGH